MSIASVNISWHPEEFEKNLNVSIASGINAAAAVLARQMQNNVVERPGAERDFSLALGSRGGGSRRRDRGPEKNSLGQIGMQSVISQPGQFPSYQFGNMRRSIRVHKAATQDSPFAIAGSRGLKDLIGFDYARGLEFGYRTKDGGFVAPRPWCRPAIAMAKDRMMSAFKTGARLPNYGGKSGGGSSAGAVASRAGSLVGAI